MKNKVLFTAMMLTAAYGYSSDMSTDHQNTDSASSVVPETTENASEKMTSPESSKVEINLNPLGFDVQATIKCSSEVQQYCKVAVSVVGFGVAYKYIPQVITPSVVRLGLIAAAGLYAIKSYQNCSWNELYTDLKEKCLNPVLILHPVLREVRSLRKDIKDFTEVI